MAASVRFSSRSCTPLRMQPMDEGLDFQEPQSTAISSSQPHGGEEAAQPAAPAAVPLPQQGDGALGAGTAAAEAVAPPPATGNAQTPHPEHSTPTSAAAAQAVGAAAAAAAAQGTPKGSKRSAQAAGLSPRSGGKQQRVDLLLGLASGRLPVAEQAQPLPQQAQQQRRCRVCDSATFGPASGCWHRHPETKQEWLCHNCYAKALRQFRKKQAQQAQNQAQQPGGMAAAAAAAPAAPAVGPSAAGAAEAAAPAEATRAAWVGAAEAPPLLDHQTQDGAPRDAQQGGTAAEPAPQPPAQLQQQSSAEGVVPPASQPGRSAAAAGASRPLHSHSGMQRGPPAQTAPAAAAAGAIAAAPAAGDAPGPSQYDLYRQAKQALAASGATGGQEVAAAPAQLCGFRTVQGRACTYTAQSRNRSSPLPPVQRSCAMPTCSRCSCGCPTSCNACTPK